MAELSWGVKRACNSCGARFYDLKKSPATCPKCGATFELLTAARGKRGKAVAKEVVLPLDDLDLVLGGDDVAVVDDPALLEEEDDAGFGDIPDMEDDSN